jgi:hypothetical protein
MVEEQFLIFQTKSQVSNAANVHIYIYNNNNNN